MSTLQPQKTVTKRQKQDNYRPQGTVTQAGKTLLELQQGLVVSVVY